MCTKTYFKTTTLSLTFFFLSHRVGVKTVGELRPRVPFRLHFQVVETTVVLPVVSERVGVCEDGEDTVTGVGRERLEKESGRKRERGSTPSVFLPATGPLVDVFSRLAR